MYDVSILLVHVYTLNMFRDLRVYRCTKLPIHTNVYFYIKTPMYTHIHTCIHKAVYTQHTCRHCMHIHWVSNKVMFSSKHLLVSSCTAFAIPAMVRVCVYVHDRVHAVCSIVFELVFK